MTTSTTPRLTIEELAVGHAPGLFDALDDERVGRFIGGPDVTTLDALRNRIERLQLGPDPGVGQTWLNFAVLLDATVIGRVEATLHDGIAEIAYVFGPRWWGHGYATEATGWLMAELRERGVDQLWATVAPGNDASERLLTRLGFASVEPPAAPALLSFDPGDRVFTTSAASAVGVPRHS